MRQMNPRLRLWLCAGVILLSAAYGLLVAKDRRLAEAVALGYIGVVLTIFAVINVWKKS